MSRDVSSCRETRNRKRELKRERKKKEKKRKKKVGGRRTVESRVYTSDVSERMRPSQSDLRREYKSQRVIQRPLHVCTRERSLPGASMHRCGRTRPLRRSNRSSLRSCFLPSRIAVHSSAFRFLSSPLTVSRLYFFIFFSSTA
ncbi:hypothetical protein PUN28_018509 [Cardiocondyla obscurior]|uniref:Transmembrane protein n=1 Tax=Cardiocondyla obscurior TaxID=286306 RepID=A0AAW2EHZ0_9HYME